MRTVFFSGVSYRVKFKIILLVSDIPATASILNMHHHLAKYACTLCLVQTQLGNEMRFFPNRAFVMRTPEVHNECLQKLETENLRSYRGVKGRCKIFDLIDNLPLAAPVDVMHQVYMGVSKVLMIVISSKTAKGDLEVLDRLVQSIQVSFT